jgi:hypothetical protein
MDPANSVDIAKSIAAWRTLDPETSPECYFELGLHCFDLRADKISCFHVPGRTTGPPEIQDIPPDPIRRVRRALGGEVLGFASVFRMEKFAVGVYDLAPDFLQIGCSIEPIHEPRTVGS